MYVYADDQSARFHTLLEENMSGKVLSSQWSYSVSPLPDHCPMGVDLGNVESHAHIPPGEVDARGGRYSGVVP